MRRCLLLVALALAGCGGGTRTNTHSATTTGEARPPTKAYVAALRYAKCMRARGLPFPMPTASGDFHLSYPRERAMKKAATAQVRNADDAACFHFLKGTVSTKPLSPKAQRDALVPLRALKNCLESHGYTVGKPIVRQMSRGRAMFGFTRSNAHIPTEVQHGCEREVKLAHKLDMIIARDRSPGR